MARNTRPFESLRFNDKILSVIQTKTQELEIMTCLKCGLRLVANKFQLDDDGNRVYMWACPNATTQYCDFPLDMPANVFWVKATPEEQERNHIPPPQIHLIPPEYRHMYPSVFRGVFQQTSSGLQSNTSGQGDDVSDSGGSEGRFLDSEASSDGFSWQSTMPSTPEPSSKARGVRPPPEYPPSSPDSGTEQVSISGAEQANGQSCSALPEQQQRQREEEETAERRSVETITPPATIDGDLESDLSDGRSSRASAAGQPLRTITQTINPAAANESSKARQLLKRGPPRQEASDPIGEVYSMFKQRGMNEESVGESEMMSALMAKICDEQAAYKLKKSAVSSRVDDFNVLYRERVCKIDYGKVKKRVAEQSPGVMAIVNMNKKLRQASDAREVFNALGVERTASLPSSSIRTRVKHHLSKKYNDMMVQAKLNEERHQIERERAEAQKEAEEEANRVAGLTPKPTPITQQCISTVKDMIQQKKAVRQTTQQPSTASSVHRPLSSVVEIQYSQPGSPATATPSPGMGHSSEDLLHGMNFINYGGDLGFGPYQPMDVGTPNGGLMDDPFYGSLGMRDPFAPNPIPVETSSLATTTTATTYETEILQPAYDPFAQFNQTPATTTSTTTNIEQSYMEYSQTSQNPSSSIAYSAAPAVPTQSVQASSALQPPVEDSTSFLSFFGGDENEDEFVNAILDGANL